MSRIPQLWNWLDYGHRQVAQNGRHAVSIMEFDFYTGHEDVPSNVVSSGPAQGIGRHGVAVLGVAAANGTNTIGLQGVTPFADPIRAITWQTNSTGGSALKGPRLGDIAAQICGSPSSRIINVSSGIKHQSDPFTNTVSSSSSTTWATWMDDAGDLWASAFENVAESCTDKFLVLTSAGNDGVDTRYNHPIANIACRKELYDRIPNFLTVENVRADGTTSPSSNRDVIRAGDVAGHAVSAGGTQVGLLGNASSTAYRKSSGTSYAAPFVAGLANFLWTLDPDLSVSQLKTLLMSLDATHLVPGSTSDLVDGYAAALHIDRIRGNQELQKALVDVDDGTLDGNLRTNSLAFEQSPDTIHTSDKRRGDGKVTMSDFRAFRDAFLEAVNVDSNLDGLSTHFKRDLNFDGIAGGAPVSPEHPTDTKTPSAVNNAPDEDVYARYDFNGNGRIDPGNLLTEPLPSDVSPFKADPDSNCAGRNVATGCVLDIDVLLDPDLWEITDENLRLEGGDFFGFPPGQFPPAFDWHPINVRMTNLFGGLLPINYLPYLWSCDFHLDVEATDPNAPRDTPVGNVLLQADGLWLQSAALFSNARGGEWQGVMTLPVYNPTYHPTGALPDSGQGVVIQYKKTLGQEWRQYQLYVIPGPGEDVLLELGMEKLMLRSTTREIEPAFAPKERQFEIVAKIPGAAPYASLVVNDSDPRTNQEVADELANANLATRIQLFGVFGPGGEINGIFETEAVGDTARRVKLVGAVGQYQ
jgi:hypothetical protein